jgi:hypothetical protein
VCTNELLNYSPILLYTYKSYLLRYDYIITLNESMCIIQAENLSRSQLVDYFVISAMTFLWAFMPTDGIAIVTHYKVVCTNELLNYSPILLYTYKSYLFKSQWVKIAIFHTCTVINYLHLELWILNKKPFINNLKLA